MKRICSYAFCDCEQLSRIDFSENSELELIDDFAFKSCYSLREVRIPIHVKRIGHSSFSKCKKLRKVNFEEECELEVIDEGAFSWSFVENIVVPKKTKFVGIASFIGCASLQTVELLCDDLSIGKRCFFQCKNLFIVSFPNAHKISVSFEAFKSCSSDFSLFIFQNCKFTY